MSLSERPYYQLATPDGLLHHDGGYNGELIYTSYGNLKLIGEPIDKASDGIALTLQDGNIPVVSFQEAASQQLLQLMVDLYYDSARVLNEDIVICELYSDHNPSSEPLLVSTFCEQETQDTPYKRANLWSKSPRGLVTPLCISSNNLSQLRFSLHVSSGRARLVISTYP